MANMASKLQTLSFQRSSSLFYSLSCFISLSIFLISALIVIIFLSSFDFFHCCDKNMIKTNLKRTVLISSYSLLSITGKARASAQGHNLEARTETETPEGHSLLVYSLRLAVLAFLYNAGLPAQGSAHPCRSLIKKMPPQTCLQANMMGIFLS